MWRHRRTRRRQWKLLSGVVKCVTVIALSRDALLRYRSSLFRSRHNSTSYSVSALSAPYDSDPVPFEAEESEGPQSALSFRRLLERESVAALINMVSSSTMQGKTNAAIALGHLGHDRQLNDEVRLAVAVVVVVFLMITQGCEPIT